MNVSLLLRRHTARALPFCIQVALISAAASAREGKYAWLSVLLLGVVSIASWLGELRKLHIISATPISHISSAAQGYVALQGNGRPLAGLPLLSPFNGLPVLWYRLHTEERDHNNDWRTVSEDESDACLILEDVSGQCAIDPVNAEVHTMLRERETRDNMRYTHWCIIDRTPLFVLGDFRTTQGESVMQTERETIKEVLADWKHDKADLLRRFDLNKDGEISEEEWTLARAEAQREARRQRIDADKAAAMHMVKQPPDRRPFIISAVKPWRLKLPHRAWCVWHIAIFLLSCVAIGTLQQTGKLALL